MKVKNKQIQKNLESNLFKWGEYEESYDEESRRKKKVTEYNVLNYLLGKGDKKEFFRSNLKRMKIDFKPYETLSYNLDTKTGMFLFLMKESGWKVNEEENSYIDSFLKSSTKELRIKLNKVKKYSIEKNDLLHFLLCLEDSFILGKKDYSIDYSGIKFTERDKEEALKFANSLIEEFEYAETGGEGYEKKRGIPYSERVEAIKNFISSFEKKVVIREPKKKILTIDKKIKLLEFTETPNQLIGRKCLGGQKFIGCTEAVLFCHIEKKIFFINSQKDQLDILYKRSIKNYDESSYFVKIKDPVILNGVVANKGNYLKLIEKLTKKKFNGRIPSKCMLLWRK